MFVLSVKVIINHFSLLLLRHNVQENQESQAATGINPLLSSGWDSGPMNSAAISPKHR